MDVQVRCFALLRELSADRTTISVADGARIEIVQFVGGG